MDNMWISPFPHPSRMISDSDSGYDSGFPSGLTWVMIGFPLGYAWVMAGFLLGYLWVISGAEKRGRKHRGKTAAREFADMLIGITQQRKQYLINESFTYLTVGNGLCAVPPPRRPNPPWCVIVPPERHIGRSLRKSRYIA